MVNDTTLSITVTWKPYGKTPRSLCDFLQIPLWDASCQAKLNKNHGQGPAVSTQHQRKPPALVRFPAIIRHRCRLSRLRFENSHGCSCSYSPFWLFRWPRFLFRHGSFLRLFLLLWSLRSTRASYIHLFILPRSAARLCQSCSLASLCHYSCPAGSVDSVGNGGGEERQFPRLGQCKAYFKSPISAPNRPWSHAVAGLRQLERLTLAITAVTDEGLVHLAGLSELSRTLLGNEQTADCGSIEPHRNVHYPTAVCTAAARNGR